MKEFTSTNFDAEISKGIVVVDLWAPWCGPCRLLTPLLEELSSEMTDVKFGKLNVDAAQDIALRFNVMSIPTIIVFKNGEVVNTTVGVVSKSNIKSKIEEAL